MAPRSLSTASQRGHSLVVVSALARAKGTPEVPTLGHLFLTTVYVLADKGSVVCLIRVWVELGLGVRLAFEERFFGSVRAGMGAGAWARAYTYIQPRSATCPLCCSPPRDSWLRSRGPRSPNILRCEGSGLATARSARAHTRAARLRGFQSERPFRGLRCGGLA